MHRRQAVLTLLLTLAARAADFSGASALEFARKAVAFGPRPPGTPAIANLRAFIKAELRKTGATLVDDRFTAPTPTGPVAMENVVARFPGTSGRRIVITGHYDTKPQPGFVGANDGGSSTGFLLEFARALSGAKRKDDVFLVFFDGEEAFRAWTATDSLYGSRHLAARWAAEGALPAIKALINVDMIGDRDLSILNEYNSNAWLRKTIWSAAASLGLSRHFQNDPSYIEDDHMPFVKAGVPAADLIDFDYGPGNRYWHTNDDTIDKLAAPSFEVVGRVLLETVRRLEQ